MHIEFVLEKFHKKEGYITLNKTSPLKIKDYYSLDE